MKFKDLLFQENSNLTSNYFSEINPLNNIIKNLDINKSKLKKIEALFSGQFQSFVNGIGFDFNEIREYKIGDDLRHISWSTTAKTGKLHTKEFNTEKEARVFFIVDISNSMFFGNKLEPFIKIFAYLLSSLQKYSEKMGGVFFANDIKYYFPHLEAYSQSNIMFQSLIKYYLDLEKNIFKKESSSNFSKAIDFTKQFIKKKGIVIVISDLLNIKDWEKSFFNLSKTHNVYLFQIYDSIDFEIQKMGYITLIDPETNEKFIVNTDSDSILENYKNSMKEKQEEVNHFFRLSEAKHILIEKYDFL